MSPGNNDSGMHIFDIKDMGYHSCMSIPANIISDDYLFLALPLITPDSLIVLIFEALLDGLNVYYPKNWESIYSKQSALYDRFLAYIRAL